MKLESTLTGVAGEYFVAAELTLRKYVAAISLRNTRGVDIIATSADVERPISIQVKSNSSGKPKWILSSSSEKFFSDTHFYVFVALHELGQRPQFHIVPSKVVADTIYGSHREWLAGTKKDGTKRKDTPMRSFSDFDGLYLDQWDLLENTG